MIEKTHLEPIDIIDWSKVQLTAKSMRRTCPGMGLGESIKSIDNWCKDYESNSGYVRQIATFYFENKKDAIMFALRWI